MGLWDKIKDFGKKVWDGGKELVKKAGEAVTTGIQKVKDAFSRKDAPKVNLEVERLRREQERLKQEIERLKWEQKRAQMEEEERKEAERVRQEEEKIRREKERKAEIKRKAELLDNFQDEVATRASEYELQIKKQYYQTYSLILEELEKHMDVSPIRKKIDETSKLFKNKMRDKVNAEINVGNRKLTALMDDISLDFESYRTKVNEYTDSIYYSAREELLKLLQVAVNDTNKFISEYANKFMQETILLAEQHKNILDNLTKEGEIREAQLAKSAEEYSVLMLIKQEAETNIEDMK